VSAGCPPRITRLLVLLADPPLVSPVAAEPAGTAAPAPSTARAGAAPAAEPPSTPQATPQAPAPRATRPATPPRAARTAPRRAPEAAARAETSGTAVPRPARSAAASPRPGAPERAGRSRLRLDAPTVAVNPAAVQAAEAQASAAEAQASAARLAAATAEAAASAAQQRLKDVETEMARLRAEAQAQTDALVQLRQQIAQDQAQRQKQSWVNPLLLVATVVMAVLALGIALRSRRQEPLPPQREVWWDKAGVSEPPALDPDEDSVYHASTFQPSARVPLRMPSAPAPLGARDGPPTNIGLDSLLAPPTVAAPMAVTIPPMPPRVDESSRAVSVDEQIDLEQQADFFIALGHDESAVDLLMAHLRSTGGGTPLPFLKLLEIHRRRDDREAYERTRVRFNQRFNSVAPEWHSEPGVGRSLEDYPPVVGRIQHAWPRPLDAMAELEALLFRRGAGSEMFDLPAYQEVLFLYQLARDLHQVDRPDDADNVDVLLPIGAAAPPAPEGTIVLRPEFNSGEALSLDLDLTTKTGAIDSGSPGVELDLGGGERYDKPAGGDGDVWSEDPDERRRK
jgi:pilus assembly protein FimV